MIGWFPPTWRQRYGAELEALIADMAAEGGHGGTAAEGGHGGTAAEGGHGGTAAEGGRLNAGGWQKRPSPRRPARWRFHIDVARAGLAERWRQTPGAALVLWGWACFVVAGANFAKWAEHFHRLPVAVVSYDVVEGAAVAGALAVIVAAAVLLPSTVSWLGGVDGARSSSRWR